MFRRLTVAALTTTLLFTAVPARADDELTRRLIDQCVGCRFPKDLHSRDLHGLRFVGSDLSNVDFSHANLNGARFVGADLAGAKFDDADLRNARFAGVRFRHTSFARAKLDGVRMAGVDLSGDSVVGVDPKSLNVRPRRRAWVADGDWWMGPYGSDDAIPPIPRVPPMPPMPPMPPIPDVGPQVERSMRDLRERLNAMPLPPCRCTEERTRTPRVAPTAQPAPPPVPPAAPSPAPAPPSPA